MKVFNSAVLEGNELRLTTALIEFPSDERKKKIGTPDCIWDPKLAENFRKQGEWLEGGFARAGVSAAVISESEEDEQTKMVIMNRFDSGHPSRAGQLTPPAGLWDTNKGLKEAALAELGEEVINKPFQGTTHLLAWFYDDHETGFVCLTPDWCQKYAEAHQLSFGADPYLDGYGPVVVDMNIETDEVFNIYVDDVFQGVALIACEGDTGSIEFIFLFGTDIYLEKGLFLDGEMFGDQYLNREVEPYSVEELEKELEAGKLTTKAQAILSFMKNL